MGLAIDNLTSSEASMNRAGPARRKQTGIVYEPSQHAHGYSEATGVASRIRRVRFFLAGATSLLSSLTAMVVRRLMARVESDGSS